MPETTGPDEATRLLSMFLRGRDVPCPLCGYNLRDLTQPQCPECRHELLLTLGVTKPRFLWFLVAVAPCIFAGILAVLMLIPMVIEVLAEGRPPPPPFIIIDALAWLSALGGFLLIRRRFAFLRRKPGRQCLIAIAVWALHGLAVVAFFVIALILTGGP